jgi:hypothetical protein
MVKNYSKENKLVLTALAGLLALLPALANALANAQTNSTTFPVNQAGMAAYVKLDSISAANFDNAKQSLFDQVETAGSTYLIGTKLYSVDASEQNKVNFHIYLGADGWLVVYLTKDQEPSRMVNWRSGTALSDTLLKYALEDAIQKIGATAANPIAYYDFAFPDAQKMTLVRENVNWPNNGDSFKKFTALVPGTIYQASYSLKCDGTSKPNNYTFGALYIDEQLVKDMPTSPLVYGIYDGALFTANQSHTIQLNQGYTDPLSGATLILYKTN